MIRHQQVATLPIDKLRPNPRNARTHTKKQIRQLADSIMRFGWTYPILADEKMMILGGHAPYSAAQLLGYSEVPIIIISGLSDAEKRALTLADNKIAANAGWDRKLLAEELGELATLLPEFDLELEITGFEPAEVDNLLGDLVDPRSIPPTSCRRHKTGRSAEAAICGSSVRIGSYAATRSLQRRTGF